MSWGNCVDFVGYVGDIYFNTPTIDGHFWVERDGQIIDPHFERDFKFIQDCWACNGNKRYMEASEEIQTSVIIHFKLCVMKQLQVKKWEKVVEIVKQAREYVGYTPRFEQCWINTLFEVIENGGVIKFGSFGFEKRDGSGVHWEYGGENYTIKDFGNGRAFCRLPRKK